MPITKSQKIALGFLGVAVVALVADRMTGKAAPSAQPPAASAFVEASTPVLLESTAKSDVVAATSADTLAGRLALLDQGRPHTAAVRDAFKPSAKWLAELSVAPTPALRSQVQFVATHHIKAIIEAGVHSAVEIDGSLIRVGQTIDGFQLDSVNHLSAEFSQGPAKVKLHILQDPGAGTNGSQSE